MRAFEIRENRLDVIPQTGVVARDRSIFVFGAKILRQNVFVVAERDGADAFSGARDQQFSEIAVGDYSTSEQMREGLSKRRKQSAKA